MTSSTETNGVTLSRGRLVGLAVTAVVVGMLVPGLFSGSSGAPRVPAPATAGGPDVGEIRVGPNPAGPTRSIDGIGVGFAHDEAGAIAAATNLILTLEQAGQATRPDAIAAYETLAADGSVEALSADMGAVWDAIHNGLDTNAPPGAALFIRAIPVGHDLIRYQPDRSTVEVWTLTLLVGSGMTRPVATWETATIELVWQTDNSGDGEVVEDWKVWSVTTRPGPSAGWDAVTVSTVPDFLAEMTDLEGYRYVTN